LLSLDKLKAFLPDVLVDALRLVGRRRGRVIVAPDHNPPLIVLLVDGAARG
jgi:hypothetical protein